MTQAEFDFTAPAPTLYPEHRVRKTMIHNGSDRRRQHVYIRMTEQTRRAYNSCIGGFKHFLGSDANGAEIFERFGLPAMQDALKRLAGQTNLAVSSTVEDKPPPLHDVTGAARQSLLWASLPLNRLEIVPPA